MAVSFSKILYDFEAFLDVQKNLSPKTREAYIYDLERFSDFLTNQFGKVPSPNNIEKKDLVNYLEHIQMQRKLKSTTMSRTLASIRVFFEYCASEDLIRENPAQFLHNPKTPRKLPVFLTSSELGNLFEAPDKTTTMGIRDYAILVTLSFTGVRLSEIVGLKINDMNFTAGANFRVLGKGRKERILPLNDVVVDALQNWLAVRPSSDDPNVFLNRFDKKMTGRSIENIVEKYVKLAGLSHIKISPHKLRHTFATLLHMKDVDLLEIQALMGHASITSTQIYTHTNPERQKSAVKKLEGLI